MNVVSVVLAVRDGEPTIGAQLEALLRQRTDREWELVVVDNGSQDLTVRVVKAELSRFASARLIDGSNGIGAGFARNCGADVAVGETILFCDADDEVDELWLENLADGVDRHEFVGGALDRRRLHTGHSRGPGVPTTRDLHRTADGQPFAVGANIGVNRRLFRRLDGFDASFVGGNEDADLAIRAAAIGHVPQFCPEAIVHYRERSTRRASFKQYRRYGRTEPQLYRKHRAIVARRRPVDGLRFWGRVPLVAARGVRDPHARVLATRLVGRGVGRIEGSIRHRVLFW